MVDLATDDQRFGAFAFAKSSFCTQHQRLADFEKLYNTSIFISLYARTTFGMHLRISSPAKIAVANGAPHRQLLHCDIDELCLSVVALLGRFLPRLGPLGSP
jgi:hypothetical protein